MVKWVIVAMDNLGSPQTCSYILLLCVIQLILLFFQFFENGLLRYRLQEFRTKDIILEWKDHVVLWDKEYKHTATYILVKPESQKSEE